MTLVKVPGPASPDAGWVTRFHAGDRAVLADCYREHFGRVKRVVIGIVPGADHETVIHELFSNLLAQEELRRSFKGGSFAAWIVTVARHRAIDYRRRIGREVELGESDEAHSAGSWELATQARLLVEQFQRTRLPPEWQGVFELRFLQQLPQREAARRLAMQRTTLAYRELRIQQLLKRFLLDEDTP